ncbi:MAG: sigma-70 family RNA polymerase sigma factor [Alistipes sp.]|jgi:RNA polymerase sigma-70 factor (ECF subfamily)|nr:sigma-70 family RNA polymerase sigma factor [Alistipes sp.]
MAAERYDIYDDRTLAKMVTEGDSIAFDTLFARHSDSIYAMLLKFTGNSDDVNDLMQEAFMKAFLKIGLYDSKYDFGAWIYTIARNTFVDFSRTRKSSAFNPQNLSPEIDNTAQSSSPTPEDYIINAQQRAQIERYISMLPEDYRQLFELRFLDEYSYEEIAEKLDMKLGTVKTRIFRVRNMMCRLITESEEQAKK